jgi:hypothetical protein
MLKMKMAFLVMMVALVGVSNAQEVEISDDELMRYAVVMDSIEVMKDNVKEVISEMVSSNEDMTGTRYNELSKIIEDTDKLAATEATETEIAFIKSVKEKSDEMTQEINSAFQSLAVNYIGDGGRVYKKIKSALKTDESVKERYEVILASLDEGDAKETGDPE